MLNVVGIKCDNPKCDFIDNSVKFEDYDQWLNKRCPQCGHNLLTEADYNNVKDMINKSGYFSLFLNLFSMVQSSGDKAKAELEKDKQNCNLKIDYIPVSKLVSDDEIKTLVEDIKKDEPRINEIRMSGCYLKNDNFEDEFIPHTDMTYKLLDIACSIVDLEKYTVEGIIAYKDELLIEIWDDGLEVSYIKLI